MGVVAAQEASEKHRHLSDEKDGDDATIGIAEADKEARLEPIDPAVERRVRWKIDLVVLPLFFLIYGMQYLGHFNS